MKDNDIITLLFERSENALEEVRTSYGKYCMSIACGILHSERDAEECFDDALIALWNAIPPLIPNDLKSYIGSLTRHMSLNRLDSICAQKRKSNKSICLDEYAECIPDNYSDFADSMALKEAINSFLSSLPKETRMIFMRRYWYHLEIKDIASLHNMSESNVKVILHRTRKKFKEHLESKGVTV